MPNEDITLSTSSLSECCVPQCMVALRLGPAGEVGPGLCASAASASVAALAAVWKNWRRSITVPLSYIRNGSGAEDGVADVRNDVGVRQARRDAQFLPGRVGAEVLPEPV